MSDGPGQHPGWGAPVPPPRSAAPTPPPTAPPYTQPAASPASGWPPPAAPGSQPGQPGHGPAGPPAAAPKGNGPVIVTAVIGAIVLVAGLGVGALVLFGRSASHDWTGTLKVYDLNHTGEEVGAPCSTFDVDTDIATGGAVSVSDGNGKPLATGALGSGRIVSDGFGDACAFSITVNDVPRAPRYQVELGTRDAIEIEHTELEADSFRLDLSLNEG